MCAAEVTPPVQDVRSDAANVEGALESGAAHRVADVLVAIYVPLAGAIGAIDEEGERVGGAEFAIEAAREPEADFLEKVFRARAGTLKITAHG